MPHLPSRRFAFCALLCSALLVGCATSAPVVYQRPAADNTAQARIARDTDACRRQATEAVGVNGHRSAGTGRDVAKVGAIGFVGAAVGSAVTRSKEVWQRARGAAAAGVSGVATKLLFDWNEPDEVHQEYVAQCMKERGHTVLGWR
jgi:hypothetical protein